MAQDSRPRSKSEIITYEGKPARKYPDGTIRNERGQVVTRTPESAKALADRRHQLAKDAIISGVKKATGEPTFYKAIEKLAAVRAEVAMKDKGRAGNDAYTKLLIQMDAYRPNQQVEVRNIQQNNSLNVEMPQAFYDALDRLTKQNVIEGELHDEG